jgi:hypothetical protein
MGRLGQDADNDLLAGAGAEGVVHADNRTVTGAIAAMDK